jgi:hypothetical protein
VSNRYSGPRRARTAAAVTSFTFDAGFISASASLLKTTLPSSRLTSWTPSRASRKGARWARSRRVFFRASRSAALGGPAWAGPTTRQADRSAASRKGRRGDKLAALRGERPMDGSSPAGLQGRKVGRALTRRPSPPVLPAAARGVHRSGHSASRTATRGAESGSRGHTRGWNGPAVTDWAHWPGEHVPGRRSALGGVWHLDRPWAAQRVVVAPSRGVSRNEASRNEVSRNEVSGTSAPGISASRPGEGTRNEVSGTSAPHLGTWHLDSAKAPGPAQSVATRHP